MPNLVEAASANITLVETRADGTFRIERQGAVPVAGVDRRLKAIAGLGDEHEVVVKCGDADVTLRYVRNAKGEVVEWVESQNPIPDDWYAKTPGAEKEMVDGRSL
jgi:hypothetical protein